MNQKLQNILDIIQQSEKLDAEQKDKLLKAVKDADKELEITAFKLERTEKVKKTTAILLEETIEELELKRKAVEEQNRELEIEASLERVRAQAMGMTKSDNLMNVCEILYKELTALGFEFLRNSMIAIFNDEEVSFQSYDYSDHLGKVHSTIPYKGHRSIEKFLSQIRKSKRAFAEVIVPGSEVEELKKHVGEKKDSRVKAKEKLYYYFYSIGLGAIGVSTFKPIKKNQLEILRRFRNVFDLAYRRYNDISLAEAQAREAQIEASLEKVRASAMSIHKSEDLLNVSEILYRELRKLGFNEMRNALINIHNDANKTFLNYDYSDEIGKSATLLDYNAHPVMEKQIKQSRIADDAFSEAVFKGKDLEAMKEFRRKYGEKDDPRIKNITALYYYFYSTGNGTIGISTFIQIDENKLSLLKRFRNVFNLAYKRYTDITLAEAQAREAQIQASLERVRAQAMGMMRSEDLLNICKAQFTELKQLGFGDLRNSLISIFNDDKGYFLDYDYSDFAGGSINNINYNAHPAIAKSVNKIRKGKDVLSEFSISGKELDEWNEYRRNIGEREDPRLENISALYYYMYSIGSGAIGISNFKPVTEEQLQILKRFRNVFDLAYRRYNDIAIAEAQAKEAQIEAALERVRSRTMGMQKSEELKEVIQLVYEQFVHLKINVDHAGFVVDYTPKGDWHFWIADERDIPSKITHPYFDSVWAHQFEEAKEKGIDFFVTNLNFEEKNKFYNELLSYVPDLPQVSKDFYLSCPGLAATTVLFDDVSLYIENFSGTPYSDDENKILMRFGKVFQQTYTRFLDLKKAEVQAREAEVELALERVRAKAMAMHKSDDLTTAVATVFSELDRLGFRAIRCGIGIFNNQSRKVDVWTTSSDDNSGSVHISGDEVLEGHPLLEGIFEAWQLQKDYSYILEGQELLDYYILAAGSNLPVSAPKVTSEMTKQYYHCIMFPSGGLFAFRESEFSTEAKNLMRRFADVFQLTFTRHLDLRKAEAQAREAQIEASLERVRAVAMSMHTSDDLLSICEVSFKEFKKLGIDNLRNVIIHILNDEKKYFMDYDYSDHLGGNINNINYNAHPIVENYLEQIKKAEDAFAEVIVDGSDLDGWKDFRRRGGQKDDPKLNNIQALYYYLYSIGIGDIGISTLKPIDKSQLDILKRFRNVFDLAYRRYNDIALAEEQARETQIQLALERVRAKAMAMHSSKDLAETIGTFYTELKLLGVTPRRCGVALINQETRVAEVSTMNTTEEGDSVGVIGKIKMSGHPILENIYDNWLIQKEYHTVLRGNQIKEYYQVLKPQITYPDYPHDVVQFGYYFMFKEGDVYAWTDKELVEEELKIFRRFTTVISLTYKRYIDLQNAEEQARESQIQLALERVRARTMAMHKSEELSETSFVLFEQLKELGEVAEQISIGIFNEKDNMLELYATIYGSQWKETGRFPLTKHPVHKKTYEAWKSQKKSLIIDLSGEELADFNKFKMETSTQYKSDDELPKNRWVIHSAFFSKGVLIFSTHEPRPVETLNILERFAGVFDLTYTRFLDLQKAEAQAREAEIEAALERVRSRTMAMQKSNELAETASHFFEQLNSLGIKPYRFNIAIVDTDSEKCQLWSTTNEGKVIPLGPMIPLTEYKVFNQIYDGWKQQKNVSVIRVEGEERITWTKYIMRYVSFNEYKPENIDMEKLRNEPAIFSNFFFKQGFVVVHTIEEINETDIKIIQRFVNVFEQTYTRFLDLKNAEAQAREAEIQLALERVRARTMAMHKSSELAEVAKVLFDQMSLLDNTPDRFNIRIINEAERAFEFWATDQQGNLVDNFFKANFDDSPIVMQMYISWKANEKVLIQDIHGDQLIEWVHYIKDILGVPFNPQNLKEHRFLSSFFFSHGMIGITTNEAPNPVTLKLIERFTIVFQQTYTRFLDLQKAEAQAREAQIESALERVRAKAMAMHSSNDLSDTMGVLFSELPKLGISSLRCGVVLLSKKTRQGVFYAAATTQESDSFTMIGAGDMNEHPVFMKQYESWLKNENYFTTLSDDELQSYYEAIFARLSKTYNPREHELKTEHGYYFSFSEGMFYAWSEKPYSEESINILNRFNAIINLTFRRYLDIQKAEEQAREARIEASLERVRSKAMAMHSPEELSDTISRFFKELKTLGIIPIRCGVCEVHQKTRSWTAAITNATQQGDTFEILGELTQLNHPLLERIYEHWESQKEYLFELQGEEIKSYYKALRHQLEIPDFSEDVIQYGNYFYFKEGFVFAWTENKLSEEELQIFRRFTSVLSLTYRRYIDLKAAEVRAFEAVRQASLDRVRAEIASMRTSEDLNHITPIIWRELKNLEVPFFRCGVYIVNELSEMVQVYLTTPDGKSLGVLNLSFDSNEITSNTVDHWRKKIVYKTHWNKQEFISWTESMMKLGQIKSAEIYQGATTPPESLYLHFVPFAQGMLYVGDVQPLTDEKLQLVKTLAEAFSIAYARYEDFKNLEEAKNKIEITLSELKSAQAQLIHSEKMASLGELTAGIAHEIKNPLNFVNNFSEVSRELLDEMQIELNNNNIDEVIDLVEDLKQNLDKINQHGKRADSIVKGMLLHSRGTSGEKTPTDINDLLDQYVNLAYHGMRAQNKEFNISIEKDYDETLEKINVVPQDISRVFLNIINNACYAAYDKKKKSDNNFSPTLKVSTKKINDRVEIKIADNGNGIPADHLDKIFQPFFTTKPSGEGTGLGLSLSYDIVTKVHGGDLKVETENGKGSTFIIELKKS